MHYIKSLWNWQWGRISYLGIGQSRDSFKGQSAPLWKNYSQKTFLMMFIIGVLTFFGILFVYIFLIDDLSELCELKFRPVIVYMNAIVGLNTIFDFKSYQKKYSSDQGWSRMLIYLSFECLLLLIGIFIAFLLTFTVLIQGSSIKNACSKEIAENSLLISTLAINGVVFLLFVMKLVVLSTLTYRYYYNPIAYLAVAKYQSA